MDVASPSFLPLTSPFRSEKEEEALLQALALPRRCGGGYFTNRSQAALEAAVPGCRAFLTHSCTAALEMACLLLDLAPGDEVILPAWTFCSTANAVALRGAVPVFVDVHEMTLNIDPAAVEAAITPRTRAIICVHYAGVGCDMDRLGAIATTYGLHLIEDAAQAVGAAWRGRPLGGFGSFAALSFHDTKNLACGEGGALLVSDPILIDAAEIAWEKGTNRLSFSRGEVSRYKWVALGSSFMPSELTAALMSVQLAFTAEITAARLNLWHRYHALLEPLERRGLLRRPAPPSEAAHNAHIYFVRVVPRMRNAVLARLRAEGIETASHYEPLHHSPAGKTYGRAAAPSLPVTEAAAASLLRLPLFPDLAPTDQERVVERLTLAILAELALVPTSPSLAERRARHRPLSVEAQHAVHVAASPEA